MVVGAHTRGSQKWRDSKLDFPPSEERGMQRKARSFLRFLGGLIDSKIEQEERPEMYSRYSVYATGCPESLHTRGTVHAGATSVVRPNLLIS